jgi:RNA polymerase sigma factor (sigma-70 family)
MLAQPCHTFVKVVTLQPPNLLGIQRVMGLRAARLLSDARLAQLAADGDERAFEVLYDRHHRALLGFCRHMVGSPHEAEDALQQTFLRAHRALLAYGAPDDPRPWLFTIARNRCKTLLAARRAEAEVDETMPATAGLAEEVQTRADLRAVVEDVARLPDDQRAALVLAELADLSHGQIGEVIGVPAGKVKALVHQARTTLIAERDAREQPCEEIREQLASARGGALRRGPLRRHLRLCAPCRAYRDAVAAQRRTLAAVLPVAPSAGLKAGILGAATGGGGAGLSAGLATKLAASAIVVGGATGGGVALVDTPKPPPPPKAAAPAATRTAVPPRPVVAVGERIERKVAPKVRVQRPRRARKPARKEHAAARREHATARREQALSRRDQAHARRDEKLATRGAPGTRGRGNAAKPVKVRKAPGSSRSPRAPAKKPHPVTRKPKPTPQPANLRRGAEVVRPESVTRTKGFHVCHAVC